MQPARCRPISSLDALWAWAPGSRPDDAASRSAVPLDQDEPRAGPRLVVCHDLQGGYGDDCLLAGGQDPEQFAIHAWHLVDAFIYFSHHLVTIPPPGWADAAHRHGIPVLGTFITEWDAGRAVCEALFADAATAGRAAAQLAAVAAFFGFEGWLVNIENSLDAAHLPHLLHFLGELRRLMRAASPRGQVLWYDAVTTEGKLRWQNSLTALNRPFFNASDGLFCNYVWKATTPAACVAAAGDRRADVLLGCDVFGRNTFGGGGFNCAAALTAAFSAGLSCALFAPGWLWETAQPLSAWRERSSRFWQQLEQACLRWRPPRPAIRRLPFASSFCQGCGCGTYRQGEAVSGAPWFDLQRQDLQPLFQELVSVRAVLSSSSGGSSSSSSGERVSLQLSWLQARVLQAAAFEGGSLLRIEGKLPAGHAVDLAVFSASLPGPPQGSLRVAAAVRGLLPGCSLGLRLAGLQPLAGAHVPAGASSHAAWQQACRLQGQCDLLAEGGEERAGGWVVCTGSVEAPSQGRIAGLHLVCSSQRPDSQFCAEIGQLRLQEA